MIRARKKPHFQGLFSLLVLDSEAIGEVVSEALRIGDVARIFEVYFQSDKTFFDLPVRM